MLPTLDQIRSDFHDAITRLNHSNLITHDEIRLDQSLNPPSFIFIVDIGDYRTVMTIYGTDILYRNFPIDRYANEIVEKAQNEYRRNQNAIQEPRSIGNP